jgi:mannitol/fructose-specific phosphotransferase system IIA component (Ntr-type)
MIAELIDNAVLLASLSATSKDAALVEMVGAATQHAGLDAAAAEVVLTKLRAREEVGSTGIGNGIAVPHAKVGAGDGVTVERVALVLALSRDGLEYDAVDGRPVHTLFLIVAPEDSGDQHHTVLRWVSTLARNADFRRFVLDCETPEAIRELLVEMTEDAG